MSHKIYIYDANRCKTDVRWSFMDGASLASVMREKLHRLEQKRLGHSPRFERLATRLLQHFPIADNSVLWLDKDPLATVRSLETGVWTLEIEEARADEFLSILLPLARQLYFTVFDPARELLVEYQESIGEYVFPASMAERDRLDPHALTDKFGRGSLRKYLVEILKPLLGKEGFVYEVLEGGGFQFRRKVEGGEQFIYGWVCTEQYGVCCSPVLKATSDRKFEVEKLRSPGEDFGYESAATFLSEEVKVLRRIWNPDWNNESIIATEYCRNFEEVDWLVEDLMAQAIPLLEKARTIEGVHWLFCQPDAKSLFGGNIYNRGSPPFRALYAARQADNSGFDEVARYFIERLEAGEKRCRMEDLQEWIRFFRDKVEPFGTGPA